VSIILPPSVCRPICRISPDFTQEGFDADALMALMAQDKKVKRGRLTFILLEAVGRAVIAPTSSLRWFAIF
jgi:3-dehydroquinate synthetase